LAIRQYLHDSEFTASIKVQSMGENEANSFTLRIIDGRDGWGESYFAQHEMPYRDERALEAWINGDGEMFGDVGASHD
jgi:hypothetical protein